MSILKLPLLYMLVQKVKKIFIPFLTSVRIYPVSARINFENLLSLSLEEPIHLGQTRKLATASEGHYIGNKERVTQFDF